MAKIEETDEIWKELRLVIFFYACLTIGYTFFLYLVYGQQPSQEWPELLKSLVNVFFAKKADISITAIYVVLTTLPLAISSFFVVVLINRDGLRNGIWPVSLAIILPFVAYFGLIDRSAISQVIDGTIDTFCHNAFENGHPVSRCGGASWPAYLFAVLLGILEFYFIKYKFPLAVGSLLLGGWAGYRMEKQLGRW